MNEAKKLLKYYHDWGGWRALCHRSETRRKKPRGYNAPNGKREVARRQRQMENSSVCHSHG